MKITASSEIKSKIEKMRLGVLSFTAAVSHSEELLWGEINSETEKIGRSYQLNEVNKIPNIADTRKAYKQLGNDPNRYRPSADSLLRRIVKGNILYRVNNVVDVLNHSSITSGFSIGGYDADKIVGDILLDIGQSTDLYKGIGRGEVNITNLPVLRDQLGAFGNPSSDSERTMITEKARNILFAYFDFGFSDDLSSQLGNCTSMLAKHCKAENIKMEIIQL